ncbi:MAG: hypothetical protein ABII13_05545 [Patescibacteria group bacterium]|nr:hypothetical protein [Patescibacteria group bacterium]MBU2509062.1 hypothetical protein [Patescibacteria group bacterium]
MKKEMMPEAENAKEKFELELDIKFGIDFEENRVGGVLHEMDWYDSHGYRPKLPKGIDRTSSEQDIQKAVEAEYSEDDFQEVEALLNDLNETLSEVSAKLERIFGDKSPAKLEINLTKYGMGGSYHPPDGMTLNADVKKEHLRKTVVHELTHLFAQPYIEKYDIAHWDKERIIDLILNSDEFTFVKYNSWQPDYRGAEKHIDPLFKKHFFQNPDDFFAKMKNAAK